jgi:CO/xanthine dehydrogenase Mo-binding subunit
LAALQVPEPRSIVRARNKARWAQQEAAEKAAKKAEKARRKAQSKAEENWWFGMALALIAVFLFYR